MCTVSIILVIISLQLSVGIEHGILESYNSDFELQFSHPLKHIVGMCRIIHKPQVKNIGNGFVQLKSNTSQAPAANCGTSAGNMSAVAVGSSVANGSRTSLTTSTSYGSLSSSTAAAYQLQQQQAADAEPQNFMEFQGPITGLVYLLKDPKDPLLHIYLFECDTVEEVRFAFDSISSLAPLVRWFSLLLDICKFLWNAVACNCLEN